MADDSFTHETVTSALVVVYVITFVYRVFVVVILSVLSAQTTVRIYEQVSEDFYRLL
jgi:hypothetical protein